LNNGYAPQANLRAAGWTKEITQHRQDPKSSARTKEVRSRRDMAHEARREISSGAHVSDFTNTAPRDF